MRGMVYARSEPTPVRITHCALSGFSSAGGYERRIYPYWIPASTVSDSRASELDIGQIQISAKV